jgi:hypothetical protein
MIMRNKTHKLPFDPDVHKPAAILIAVGAIAYCFSLTYLWIAALIVLIAILSFFRDPPRRVPRIPGAIVSPADGKITEIYTNQDPEAGPVGGPCVSIFLSVLNVHVNRAPFDGIVSKIRYRPGKFINAMNPDSSKVNESNWIHMKVDSSEMTVPHYLPNPRRPKAAERPARRHHSFRFAHRDLSAAQCQAPGGGRPIGQRWLQHHCLSARE